MIADLSNVPERTKVIFFWHPPLEHDEIDLDLPFGLQKDILGFDARYGEKRLDRLWGLQFVDAFVRRGTGE